MSEVCKSRARITRSSKRQVMAGDKPEESLERWMFSPEQVMPNTFEAFDLVAEELKSESPYKDMGYNAGLNCMLGTLKHDLLVSKERERQMWSLLKKIDEAGESKVLKEFVQKTLEEYPQYTETGLEDTETEAEDQAKA